MNSRRWRGARGGGVEQDPVVWRAGVTPRIRCASCPPVIRRRCHVMCLRVALCHVIICISYHVIMCIAFAYVFVSCIRAFPRCPFCNSALLCSPASPFTSFHVRVLNVH